MSAYACTVKRFLHDVVDHRMTIRKDDGVYRHLVFQTPGTVCGRFELLTSPGHLIILGDGGSYGFERLYDMFEFFEHGSSTTINPEYWKQKVVSVDRHAPIESFDGDKFAAIVKRNTMLVLNDEIEDAISDEDREEAIARKDEVLDMLDLDHWGSYCETYEGADQWLYDQNQHHDGLQIDELWDYDTTSLTFRFVWCCYAIRWGIAQYKLGGDHFTRQAKTDRFILNGDL